MSDSKRDRRSRVDPWVGPWLRTVRQKNFKADQNRWSLEAVAARLPGVELSTLSRIERGETLFPSDDLPAMLEAYEVSLARFGAQARKPSPRRAAA